MLGDSCSETNARTQLCGLALKRIANYWEATQNRKSSAPFWSQHAVDTKYSRARGTIESGSGKKNTKGADDAGPSEPQRAPYKR